MALPIKTLTWPHMVSSQLFIEPQSFSKPPTYGGLDNSHSNTRSKVMSFHSLISLDLPPIFI